MDEQQQQNLKIYRYKGGDTGYVYRIFYNPMANTVVNYLPETLAPNLITLIGFVFSLSPAYVLFANYGTSMKNDPGNEIPRWFFLFEAFCYFMYRVFDELDGK